jgi:hypothetical protein
VEFLNSVLGVTREKSHYIIIVIYYNTMAHIRVYVPEEQITNNEFSIHCDGVFYKLDKELTKLGDLKFDELQALSKKLNVNDRRRYTRSLIVSEIQRILTFSIPDEPYVIND